MKFKSKEIVEAVQFDGTNIEEVCRTIGLETVSIRQFSTGTCLYFVAPDKRVYISDWVLRAHGQPVVYKDANFRERYETQGKECPTWLEQPKGAAEVLSITTPTTNYTINGIDLFALHSRINKLEHLVEGFSVTIRWDDVLTAKFDEINARIDALEAKPSGTGGIVTQSEKVKPKRAHPQDTR